MICPNCNKELSNDVNFCIECGVKISKDNKKRNLGKSSAYELFSQFSKEEIQTILLINEAKKAANKIILGGIGWILAGLIITGISYALAGPGGTYFILWGLSIYGVYRLIRGIYYRFMPHKLLEESIGNIEADEKVNEDKDS